MEPRRVLRIAHLSDLQLSKDVESAWRQRRVLGEAWRRNLEVIAQDGPFDLAQSGQVAQYEQARAFIDETLALPRVLKERFFCVPGNHDVDRAVAKPAWREVREGAWEVQPAAFARWIAGGRALRGFDDAWREAVLGRQAAYRDWLAGMGLQALLPGAHGPLGYRVSLDLRLGAPLHVIGLDSARLASDDHDAGNLRLTDEQVARLLTEQGKPLPGWKIALLDRPLGELADGARGAAAARRIRGEPATARPPARRGSCTLGPRRQPACTSRPRAASTNTTAIRMRSSCSTWRCHRANLSSRGGCGHTHGRAVVTGTTTTASTPRQPRGSAGAGARDRAHEANHAGAVHWPGSRAEAVVRGVAPAVRAGVAALGS